MTYFKKLKGVSKNVVIDFMMVVEKMSSKNDNFVLPINVEIPNSHECISEQFFNGVNYGYILPLVYATIPLHGTDHKMAHDFFQLVVLQASRLENEILSRLLLPVFWIFSKIIALGNPLVKTLNHMKRADIVDG